MSKDLFAALLCLLTWAPSLPAATFLYLDSATGDYIGGGQEQTLTDTDATFRPSRNFDNGISFSVQRITGNSYWSLKFAAPGKIQIEPGMYTGATRFPFQSPTQAGLSIDGEHRGCNRLSGFFIVHEVEYASNDSVMRFAANFEQYCDNSSAPLRGAIRFNSDLPAVITNPIAAAGQDQRAREGDRVVLDGHYSTGGDSAIAAYQWQQTNGPQATLSDSGAATTEFIAPATALGGEVLTFELTVINTNGESSTDEVEITIASKSDPMTYLLLDSQAGDYIGGGIRQFFDTNDGTFTLEGNENSANITFNGEDWWNLSFAAPANMPLSMGAYGNAIRYPFRSGSTGLEVSGAGRGCNTLTGSFNVLDFRLAPSGTGGTFAADFQQHCEGGVPALLGEVRINFLDPSVPLCNAGDDQTVSAGSEVILDGGASTDPDGSITMYLWEQMAGTTVALSSTNTARPSFTAPIPTGNNEELGFKLTITDNEGFVAEDRVVITVTTTSGGRNTDGSNSGNGNGGDSSDSITGAGAFFATFLLLPFLMLRQRRRSLP